jgi:hypothetical protein
VGMCEGWGGLGENLGETRIFVTVK